MGHPEVKWSIYYYRSDGTESPLLEDHEESSPADKPKQITKYGELTILG